ncbi:hypothetical protein [Chryseobacterium salviniae]|uniref:F5/8 type C domain-containing protein n=1 Tax=Chryseobacterium salviniae TaxID=3101750 RepID=A0ABU6HQT3_9FLAO|nr:hypothetical protein [Chryseobacterium sp. T9W2-O]MEC3874991.1 hypothetical protein [Chryseobacterium sp. T9W2-O]
MDITSDNRGLLIPRVILVALRNPAPLTAHVKGMVVYNKSAVGSTVHEGFYYNDGLQWVKVNKDTSALVSFNAPDPNQSGTVFSPDLQSSINNIYASSIDGSYWKYDDVSATYISYQPDPATEWYLAGTTTDAASNKNNAVYRIGEVGIGNNTKIDPSAMLDVNSKTKGLLPPRMTQAERDAIVLPAEGLVVYCTDCNGGQGCLVYNYGKPSTPLWECLGKPNTASVTVDCASSTVNGTYIKNVANTAANTVTFRIVNNSFAAIVLQNFSTYVTLHGASTGMSIPANQNQSVSLNPGQSTDLVYTISGTPTLEGDFIARFSGNGLYCEKIGTVKGSTVTLDCANAAVNNLVPFKNLKNGTAYTGTITIPYTSSQGGVPYGAQTINVSGLTLTRSAGTFNTSGTVTYNISGTYTGVDCAEITATINVVGSETCSVKIGGTTDFKSGTYTGSNNGYGSACAATQTSMTDNSFSTGWASAYGNASVGTYIQIDFSTEKTLKEVVISSGTISCWSPYQSYVDDYTNYYTNYYQAYYGQPAYEIQYWSGTAWVKAANVPTLSESSLTRIATCGIKTTKIRVVAVNAAYWGVGTFYPVVYQ